MDSIITWIQSNLLIALGGLVAVWWFLFRRRRRYAERGGGYVREYSRYMNIRDGVRRRFGKRRGAPRRRY